MCTPPTRSCWIHPCKYTHICKDTQVYFVTHLIIHIHRKKKIAVEIAAKIASVNGP